MFTLIACLQEVLCPDDYFTIERIKFHAILNKYYAPRGLTASFRIDNEKKPHECSLRLVTFEEVEKDRKMPSIKKTFSEVEMSYELKDIFLPNKHARVISVEEWGQKQGVVSNCVS